VDTGWLVFFFYGFIWFWFLSKVGGFWTSAFKVDRIANIWLLVLGDWTFGLGDCADGRGDKV